MQLLLATALLGLATSLAPSPARPDSIAQSGSGTDGEAAQAPLRAAVDAPVNNATPLPAHRRAEAALAKGDNAWDEARTAGGQAEAMRRRALDAWRDALLQSSPGDGVRVRLTDAPNELFPDPDGLADRRGEGVSEAVLRRLSSLDPGAISAWRARFGEAALVALNGVTSDDLEAAGERLARIEWDNPMTEAAVRAALACCDLALEDGHPSAAGAWLSRAERHLQPTDHPKFIDAVRRRRIQQIRSVDASIAGRDHTTPLRMRSGPTPSASQNEAKAAPQLTQRERIIGLNRGADDPFGRGLPSGIAILGDGTALVQSALALALLEVSNEQDDLRVTRGQVGQLLGSTRALVRASASTGGWASLPATDGRRIALIAGRAERPRKFLDLEIPPAGNVLAIVRRGAKERPIDPLWVMRDGVVSFEPRKTLKRDIDPGRLAPLGAGEPVAGWTFGLGWEFQPGPILADERVYALARGLGDPAFEEADHADEVRLFAFDAVTATVLWSREVTGERGIADDLGRGDAGMFAVTTMPLQIERATGTLLVGTNVGLLTAYEIASGRLLWAFRNQRAATASAGWPGSRPPLLTQQGSAEAGKEEATGAHSDAWFTPFGSEFAYALPAGPAPLDGSFYREAPRPIRAAVDIAAVLPGAAGSTLLLLGRDGRYDAVLLDTPGETRIPAAYLAPDERLTGSAAYDVDGTLFVAGSHDLSLMLQGRGFAIGTAAPMPSVGAGRGGSVMLDGARIFVIGRDTIWIYRR